MTQQNFGIEAAVPATTVVEVGSGNGPNSALYPRAVKRVIAVEPGPYQPGGCSIGHPGILRDVATLICRREQVRRGRWHRIFLLAAILCPLLAGCGSASRGSQTGSETSSRPGGAGASGARTATSHGRAEASRSPTEGAKASLSQAPGVSSSTPDVSGKINGPDALPAAGKGTRIARGAPSDAEIRKELAKARQAGIVLPSGNTAKAFESQANNAYAGAAGWAFPIQPAGLVLSPATWTEDQGVDMATTGGACGNAAVEVAITAGTVVQEGIAGFGSSAPVIQIDAGPYKGWFVYYGHAAPALVTVGERVVAGQPVAEVGCGIVGLSSGPHLEIGLTPPGTTPCCPAWQITSSTVDALMQQLYSGVAR